MSKAEWLKPRANAFSLILKVSNIDQLGCIAVGIFARRFLSHRRHGVMNLFSRADVDTHELPEVQQAQEACLHGPARDSQGIKDENAKAICVGSHVGTANPPALPRIRR
jgi:hypothetical protein